jgi:hypothetical protein
MEVARSYVQLDNYLSAPIITAVVMFINFLAGVAAGAPLAYVLLLLLPLALLFYATRSKNPASERQLPRWYEIARFVGRSFIFPIVVVVSFHAMLLLPLFPPIPEATASLVVRMIGAIFVIGLVIYFLLVQNRSIGGMNIIYVTSTAHFIMLGFLQSGMFAGASLQLGAPTEKLELDSSLTLIGATVMKVSGGLLFVEHQEAGKRQVVFYGDQQIVRVGPIPESEKPPGVGAEIEQESLVCEFLDYRPFLPDLCTSLGISDSLPKKTSPSPVAAAAPTAPG